MLTESQLAAARSVREAAMQDACTIRQPGGPPGEFDPETGSTPVTAHAPYYSGQCRVMDPTGERELQVAEQEVTTATYVIEVPYTVITPEVGDVLTLTQSLDPWLRGKELVVSGVRGKTFGSARVLVCTIDLG